MGSQRCDNGVSHPFWEGSHRKFLKCLFTGGICGQTHPTLHSPVRVGQTEFIPSERVQIWVCLFLYLGVLQRPLTLILLQKYRDINGSRIVIQIGGVYTTSCLKKGTLLQKYRDRNGRCIAILLKSIRVRGRFDSPDIRLVPYYPGDTRPQVLRENCCFRVKLGLTYYYCHRNHYQINSLGIFPGNVPVKNYRINC